MPARHAQNTQALTAQKLLGQDYYTHHCYTHHDTQSHLRERSEHSYSGLNMDAFWDQLLSSNRERNEENP